MALQFQRCDTSMAQRIVPCHTSTAAVCIPTVPAGTVQRLRRRTALHPSGRSEPFHGNFVTKHAAVGQRIAL
jgi:hypothetical protein